MATLDRINRDVGESEIYWASQSDVMSSGLVCAVGVEWDVLGAGYSTPSPRLRWGVSRFFGATGHAVLHSSSLCLPTIRSRFLTYSRTLGDTVRNSSSRLETDFGIAGKLISGDGEGRRGWNLVVPGYP